MMNNKKPDLLIVGKLYKVEYGDIPPELLIPIPIRECGKLNFEDIIFLNQNDIILVVKDFPKILRYIVFYKNTLFDLMLCTKELQYLKELTSSQ